MRRYRIGAPADKVIAVRIDLAGRVTPIRRVRDTLDQLIPVICRNDPPGMQALDAVDFFVRVAAGHSGTIELAPGIPGLASARTIIPLGADSPHLESEMPFTAGAAGAGWQAVQVDFHLQDHVLNWHSYNLAGRMVLSEHLPAVIVALRLSGENEGEIVLRSHLSLSSSDEVSIVHVS